MCDDLVVTPVDVEDLQMGTQSSIEGPHGVTRTSNTRSACIHEWPMCPQEEIGEALKSRAPEVPASGRKDPEHHLGWPAARYRAQERY